MRVYKVKVKTTNDLETVTYGKDVNSYLPCEDGILYVVTDNPKEIYDMFLNVTSIEDVGVGYATQPKVTGGRL